MFCRRPRGVRPLLVGDVADLLLEREVAGTPGSDVAIRVSPEALLVLPDVQAPEDRLARWPIRCSCNPSPSSRLTTVA